MGLDGFSMSNLGMHRNMTSAQMANEADNLARQTLENQIADMDGVGKREKAGAKDKDAAFNGTVPFIAEDEENDENQEEQESTQDNQQNNETTDDDDNDEDIDKYHYRLNQDNLIEIWEEETNEIVRTITIDEAKNVIGKFDKVPGFLINRTI